VVAVRVEAVAVETMLEMRESRAELLDEDPVSEPLRRDDVGRVACEADLESRPASRLLKNSPFGEFFSLACY